MLTHEESDESCGCTSSRTYLRGESEDHPRNACDTHRKHQDGTPTALVGDPTENRRGDELCERVRCGKETYENVANAERTDVERKDGNYDTEADEIEEYNTDDDGDAAARPFREFFFCVGCRRGLTRRHFGMMGS